MGILTIVLVKVEGLISEDFMGKSDPYVLFELEQDNLIKDKNYGENKSSKKKDDQNPVYNETFHFNIPTLDNMVLTCKIMDDDLVHDDKIGKCKIKLEDMGLSAHPIDVKKKVDNHLFRKDAYIYLKISYNN